MTLADDFHDGDTVLTARELQLDPSEANLAVLSRTAEAPRIKLFRRMNMAPDATPVLVKMREALLQVLVELPSLRR